MRHDGRVTAPDNGSRMADDVGDRSATVDVAPDLAASDRRSERDRAR